MGGSVVYCPNCGLGQPDQHRFCISCGLPLPRDLMPARGPKVTGLFPGIATHWDDPAEPVLRVSRYLVIGTSRAPEGESSCRVTTRGSPSGSSTGQSAR